MMEAVRRQFIISATTFHIISTRSIPQYYPLTLGIRTTACHMLLLLNISLPEFRLDEINHPLPVGHFRRRLYPSLLLPLPPRPIGYFRLTLRRCYLFLRCLLPFLLPRRRQPPF